MISSRRNPLVKRLKSLSKKDGRIEHSSLLLEGTHLLEEALKTKSVPTEIISTGQWLKDHAEIMKSIPADCSTYEVTPEVLEAGLTTVSPDGVACIFPLSSLPSLPKEPKYILALDRLQDPGNVGNLFRSSLAAEFDVLWLASGADPLNQKVLRASSGSVLHIPFERFGKDERSSVEILAKKLKDASQKGWQVIASVLPNKKSYKKVIPYWDVDWNFPTILVLGNEGSGIHPSIKDCCTTFVTLPHSEAIESLNVASAAVPLLLERRRAKMNNVIHRKP